MAKSRKTSARIARLASKQLRSPRSTKTQREVAGSTLCQRERRPRGR